MTDRPLREVIIDLIDDYTVASFDGRGVNLDKSSDLADAILAALPQTEGSETVREALERLIEHAQNMEHAMHPQEYMEHGPSQVVDAARQALALPVDGWRPMSEAPKDGSSIFVYWSDHDVTEIAHWVDLEEDDEGPQWYTMAADYLPANQLSHWMPLPAPPAPDRGGEDG